MNTSIATLLESKGGAVRAVPSTVTVAEAVREMNLHRIGSILIMNGHRLVGIFTERDVLRRVVGEALDPATTPVTRVMTDKVLTVEPTTTVQEVMDIFSVKRCRHLPVMKNGQVMGLISIGDVSRWVANFDRAEAESLRQYVGFVG